MPSDDELRRVAEDVRALARSLGRDLRTAYDRARVDLSGPRSDGRATEADPSDGTDVIGGPSPAGGGPGRRSAREDLRATRADLRQAHQAVRQTLQRHRHRHWDGTGGDGGGEDRAPYYRGRGLEGPPRWDNWGGPHSRLRAGVRPGRRGRSDRPAGPPPPGVGPTERIPAPAPLPALPLRHRHDGSTLLGLLAVVFGLAWLTGGTHLAHVSAEAVVAVALMVLGAAMVVTARTDWALSRRSWPLLGGAALGVALLALSVSPNLPVGFRHLEFGSRIVTPTTWAELPTTVHAGFGKTVIDLSALTTPPPTPTTLAVDNAAGRLEIVIPADLQVVVDARVAGGQIDVDGVIVSGLGRQARQVLHPSAPGPPLTLLVQSGFGSVAISHRGSAAPAEPAPPPRTQLARGPEGSRMTATVSPVAAAAGPPATITYRYRSGRVTIGTFYFLVGLAFLIDSLRPGPGQPGDVLAHVPRRPRCRHAAATGPTAPGRRGPQRPADGGRGAGPYRPRVA